MIKVLSATAATQGARLDDYNWCVEGELIWFPPTCSGPAKAECCGCERGFGGLSSRRATTTAMVREIDLTRDDYVEALRSRLDDQGYCSHNAQEMAEILLSMADDLPTGAVIEKDLESISVRSYQVEHK